MKVTANGIEYQKRTATKVARKFYDEVCAEAESNMLKTGQLAGAHYAAMQTVSKRWENGGAPSREELE